jgi:protein kinase C substrate 80K-H
VALAESVAERRRSEQTGEASTMTTMTIAYAVMADDDVDADECSEHRTCCVEYTRNDAISASRTGAQPGTACAHDGRKLSIAQWNDGYCDCADGSDEPGTAACAGQTSIKASTTFFCANAGYLSRRLAPLFVDDGVCDCCDGTDEPAGRCANSCAEVGRAWRNDLLAQIATVKKGVAIRAQYVADGAAALTAARAELVDVDAALKRATEAAEAALAVKKTWEVREQLAQRVLDSRRAPPASDAPAAAAGSDDDIVLEGGDAAAHEADHDADAMPDEDEDVLADVEDENAAAAGPAAPAVDELHDEMFEKGPQDDATLANYVARAQDARKAWQDAEDERNKQQSRQTELAATLKEDFGPDDAFYALKGKCYSFDTPEYRYELCPYGSVTQKPLSGHGGTSMGRWDGTDAGWVAGSITRSSI